MGEEFVRGLIHRRVDSPTGLETRRWNGTKSACADYAAAVAGGAKDVAGRDLVSTPVVDPVVSAADLDLPILVKQAKPLAQFR
jgi:hypothetical protein